MKLFKNLSLSAKVLLGVILGVGTGLFFGDEVSWMSVIGDVFIGLLQMTVLPYIMISLIVNIGRLSLENGKKLVKFGLIFLSMLLGVGLLGLFVFPFSFPEWGSGSFYSNDFVLPPQEFDFVKLYIPTNLFESLSLNIVPAVVLFAIFLGVGLMKLPNKEDLLKPLDVINQGLNQVNKMVVKITPLGVFAIGAGVVSELSLADLSRLQGYLLVYILAVLVFTLVILPLIISIFTPFSPKEVLRITRPTLITIFATGKIIVVYPQLIENIKEILATKNADSEKAKSEVDIIMPLAYPFPNLGTFMIFIFIPFAAWYSGNGLNLSDYPLFLSSTLLSSFVAPITGLPFSLDLMGIPQETFQLFVVSTVLTDRIRVVLGAFHLITLALLTIAASTGIMQFQYKRLVQTVVFSGLILMGSIWGLNRLLSISMANIPTNKDMMDHFELISPQVKDTIINKPSRNPNWLRSSENVLGRIKRRGKLRVGVYPNSMPFAFTNSQGKLVGMGVDLAHQLATDLNVELEFVNITPSKLSNWLKKDYFDIVMSDIFLSSEYAQKMKLSNAYLEVSLAVLTKNENNNFDTFKSTTALDTFTLAYFVRDEIALNYISYFPQAGLYSIPDYDSLHSLSSTDSIKVDGLITSAERASAWTVLHPEYKVVNPLPYHLYNSLVFPVANDAVWQEYVNRWIDYRKKDGTIKRIYDQWVLGKEYRQQSKSWSVFHEVLGF
ncbi:MAG: cation:dicarboxylate symporter family transporter [Salibacteraceae bacterium]